MNNLCYRVVFNDSLGAWVAVAENVAARGKRSRGRVRQIASLALTASMALGVNAAPLPQAASGARAVTNVGVGSVTTEGKTMTVNQNANTAIKNWDTFNIDKGYKVDFKQPDANSRILNRIWDANPSVINGSITANGQVYLVNRNGILFGKDSQVDVGGLVASALNIKTDVFKNGFLSVQGKDAAFYYAGTMSLEKNADGIDVQVDIDTAAAAPDAGKAPLIRNEGKIGAAEGGSIMIFAPRVENAGRIETTSGQVVLAAGAKVYLGESKDPVLRGLLVEVDPFAGGIKDTSTVSNTGLKEAMQGIIANRGNITLAAMAVNNDGLLQVTTGKSENGSIYLQGRHTISQVKRGSTSDTAATNTNQALATEGGEVVLGANSRILADLESITEAEVKARAATQFAADPSESAALQASRLTALEDLVRKQYTVMATDTLKPSEVRIDGRTVLLRNGSEITAPSANVGISAAGQRVYQDNRQDSETFLNTSTPDAAARVVLEEGAKIDVTGYRDVAVDGQRNQITATLVSNELKDAPLQRNGVLSRQTVSYNLLDAPTGKLAVADTSGTVASIATSLQERAATGGSVTIQSVGDAVLGAGSKVDVSGGSVQVSGVEINTTQLLLGNKRIDITKAGADVVYDGLSTTKRFVAGYTEGKNAGSVTVVALGSTVLDGALRASTTAGAYQNTSATAPRGGTFVLGSSLAPGVDLRVGAGSSTLNAGFWDDAIKAVVSSETYNQVSVNSLSGTGFQSITLNARNIDIEAGNPVALSNGSSLTVRATGGNIDIRDDIRGAGMTLEATTTATAGEGGGNLTLAAGKRIDATGLWINDYDSNRVSGTIYDGTQQVDGGSVKLAAANTGNLVLGENSSIDVSGGGLLSRTGSVKTGNAGSINLAGSGLVQLHNADLRGTALAFGMQSGKGGSLSITAPGIRISEVAVDASDLVLAPALFSAAGFSKFSLTASQLNAAVGAGTVLDLTRNVRQLNGGFRSVATDSALGRLGANGKLDASVKDGASFSLTAKSPDAMVSDLSRGVLSVGEGAQIDAGAGGSISFAALRMLTVAGGLKAQGGSVTLGIVAPRSDLDPGQLNDQAIFLTDTARVDVSGKALVTTNAIGLRSGEVLDAGSISINADKGAVVAQQGARVSLDGTAATFDNATTRQSFAVASNGGSLSLKSPVGIVFGAQLSARGGGANAAGGSFSLEQSASVSAEYSGKNRLVTVGENLLSADGSLAGRLKSVKAGNSLTTLFADQPQSWVDATALRGAGIDKIGLASDDTLRFDGTVSLDAQREVALSAKTIDVATANAQVNSAHASLGWKGRGTPPSANDLKIVVPASGEGRFAVNSGLIDLAGGFAIAGAQQTTLASAGDLRLSGVQQDTKGTVIVLDQSYNTGNVSLSGNLDIKAQQVYSTTLSNFTISVAPGATGTGGTLNVSGTGGMPQVPLSAGSRLALEADTINQGGVLRAPFGTIELNARKSLNLLDGSLTSASGEGAVIPFGGLVNGTDWTVAPDGGAQRIITSAPTPSVALRGPAVQQSAGARIDVSGGGDLQALEFVPGSGGSTNVLTQANTYAIIPGYSSAYAPADAGFNKIAGTQITLGASAGVPAGTYTLLPARYAMLPGAYKVTVLGGYRDAASTLQLTQPLGGTVVAARFSVANTTVSDSRTTGVLVESRDITQKRSEFSDARASTFFEQQAAKNGVSLQRATQDAGQLIVAATSSIKLDGMIAMDGFVEADKKKRRNGLLDISVLTSADGKSKGDIVIGSGTTPPAGDAVTLTVGEMDIARIGAESVLIGGERSLSGTGSALRVTAREVRYNGAGGLASAAGNKPAEVILVATDRLTVESGSIIETAAADATRPELRTTSVVGDGALLRVAADNNVALRTGAEGSKGTLIVDNGVQLKGASVQADATLDSRLARGSAVTAGAFTLGAKSITLGGTGSSTDGTRLTDSLLGSVAGSADKLTLRSYSGIAFDESFTLGGVTPVKQLTLDAASLDWKGSGTGSVKIAGMQLSLTNTTGTKAEAGSIGSGGSLQLDAVGSSADGAEAGVLRIGSGDMDVRGFRETALNASRGVVLAGSGTMSVSGPLTLTAPIVTVESGARTTLKSDGTLVLAPGSGSASDALSAGAGGSVVLQGSAVAVSTQIVSRSGSVGVKAASGDVTLARGALIDVSSRETDFNGTKQATAAGKIVLESTNGSIAVKSGAALDLRGRGTADAGSLTLSASKGSIELEGSTQATAEGKAAGAAGGKLSVDISSLASLDNLVDRTTDFEAQWLARLRNGDIQVSAGKTIRSSSIGLYADQGSIFIDGKLDASGPNGGSIDLAARAGFATAANGQRSVVGGQIALGSNAVLDASATVAGGRGGSVTLSVSGADAEQVNGVKVDPIESTRIEFAAGSSIDVRGKGGGADGSVTLNAPRTLFLDDYNPVKGGVTTVGEVSVFPPKDPARYSETGVLSFAPPVTTATLPIAGGSSAAFVVGTPGGPLIPAQGTVVDFVANVLNTVVSGRTTLSFNGSTAYPVRTGTNSTDNAAARAMRPGNSYRLIFRRATTGTAHYWLIDPATPFSGSVLTNNVSTTILPFDTAGGFAGTVGEIVYFTPQASNFGSTASSNQGAGGVKLRTKTGELIPLYAADTAAGAQLEADSLYAGTAYAARLEKVGTTMQFVLLSTTGKHESLRVSSASIVGEPTSDLGIRFKPAVTNATGNVELQVNGAIAGKMFATDGVTPISAGTLVAGETYTFSRLPNGSYALRPTSDLYARLSLSASDPRLVAFSLDSRNGLPATVNVLRLKVNTGSEVSLLDATGAAMSPFALTLGKQYYASLQASGDYRLVAEDSLASRVPVVNNGLKLEGSPQITVNAFKTYKPADGKLDTAALNLAQTDAMTFNKWLPAIAGRLGSLDKASVRLGIEFRSAGDMSLLENINLAGRDASGNALWRYGADVGGKLVLRAGGKLSVNASINDGFASISDIAPTSALNGWDYSLAAGADLSAANPLAVKATTSNSANDLVVTKTIRTGTGSISLAAGDDIDMSSVGAAVYSAGRGTGSTGDMSLSSSTNTAYLTTDGGNVRLDAGADVIGRTVTSSPTDWLWRVPVGKATAAKPAAWAVRFDQFNWMTGALGGGDVSVDAGGSLQNVTIALPTQGKFAFDGSTAKGVSILGGGKLRVQAGADILGGSYLVERGEASLSAGGRVTSGATGVRLFAADTQWSVNAAGDVKIATVQNASMLLQSVSNTVISKGYNAAWNSYTRDSSLSLRSAAGGVTIVGGAHTGGVGAATVLPASLTVVALGGSVSLGSIKSSASASPNELLMMPSATGQLAVFAERNIDNANISMVDTDPALQPTPLTAGESISPANTMGRAATIFLDNGTKLPGARSTSSTQIGSLHDRDTAKAKIVARTGDVTGSYIIAKPVEISAGRDLKDLSLIAQNVVGTDVTSVTAGRDVSFSTIASGSISGALDTLPDTAKAAISVFGPGLLEVTAGRDVDLSNSAGIISKGPGINGFLPDTGASIRVVAGKPTSIDAPKFAAAWLDSASTPGFLALSRDAQISYAIEILRQGFIKTYLVPGSTYLSQWQDFAAARNVNTDLSSSDTAQRQAFDRFRYQVLWAELNASGKAGSAIATDAKANPGKYSAADLTPEKLYGKGYKALDLMGLGDGFGFSSRVRMLFSQIRSQEGGNVDVLVPGGSVDVGPTQGANKTQVAEHNLSRLGLVANQGDSRVFARDAINVNTSRWFAIDGGNLLGWTSYGDIDAGKGSRTAVSGSSQRLDVDKLTGKITLVDGGASTGSGIATIFNRPLTRGGAVDLFATRGAVDAGEAGIRAAGDVTLSANVRGADFIVAVGTSNAPTVPAAPSVALAAPSTSGTENTATEAGQPDTEKARERSSILTVEVLASDDAAPTAAGSKKECDSSATEKGIPCVDERPKR